MTFTLRSLLIAVAAIACWCGGFTVGRISGERKPIEFNSDSCFAFTRDVVVRRPGVGWYRVPRGSGLWLHSGKVVIEFPDGYLLLSDWEMAEIDWIEERDGSPLPEMTLTER